MNLRALALIAPLTLLLSAPIARAQTASVAATCSSQNLRVGYQTGNLIQLQNGDLCVVTGGGGGGGAVTTTPGARTIVPLDISTVTTGGTAVTALAAGHRTAGGFLSNPNVATINLCINEQGTASGTSSSGATTCIVPGQSYVLTPASTAVSVITSDSAHPFSGYGLN